MVNDEAFDAERHIREVSARVYAVGLHWCIHSQGAIEVARLCKKLHPDGVAILGLPAWTFSSVVVPPFSLSKFIATPLVLPPYTMFLLTSEAEQGLNTRRAPVSCRWR